MAHRAITSRRQTGIAMAVLATLTGCRAPQNAWLADAVAAGDHGRARAVLSDRVAEHPGTGRGYKIDHTYVLNRMSLALATLADGYGRHGDLVFEELFDVLRTHGINADKTVTSIVLNEGVKIWKGEPFEQALAFYYTAVHYAQQGQWGNARAAADNSLFYLRDFGNNSSGHRKTPQEIAVEAGRDEGYLDHGYVTFESNFALGYLMHGIASAMLDRRKEASDHLRKAAQMIPALGSCIERIEAGGNNLILLVDYGRGPTKIGTGPDAAIAQFEAGTPSDGRRLIVTTSDDGDNEMFTAVCDVNRMARDHMWHSLESVRLAKSQIGTALLISGAAVATQGGHRHNEDATFVGLGMLLAGLAAKAGAHIDTRHCELLPQRIYAAPIRIHSASTTINLEIEDTPSSRMILTGIEPPGSGQKALLRYVRLVSAGATPPRWADSGRIFYANESAPTGATGTLPYILGGNCVQPPSHYALKRYQDAGFLRHTTLGELEELYRLEGIRIRAPSPQSQPAQHLLEGGESLVAPYAGTAGFARIFCQKHPAYKPRSTPVRTFTKHLRQRNANFSAITSVDASHKH